MWIILDAIAGYLGWGALVICFLFGLIWIGLFIADILWRRALFLLESVGMTRVVLRAAMGKKYRERMKKDAANRSPMLQAALAYEIMLSPRDGTEAEEMAKAFIRRHGLISTSPLPPPPPHV